MNFTNGAFSALTAAEVFIVIKRAADPTTTGQGGLWNLGRNDGAFSSIVPYTDGNIYDYFGTTARKAAGSSGGRTASICCYNVSTASGAWTNRINGTQIYTTATNTVQFDAGQWLFCGGPDTTTVYMLGDFYEMLFYSRVLTVDERARVLAYTKRRYGII